MSVSVVVVVLGLISMSVGVPVAVAPPARIIGGVEAPEGSAPHMMALVVGDLAALMCGATLVGERWALTAAHCIEPLLDWSGQLLPSVRGVVGTNTWSDERVTHQFSGHRIHPRWDRWLIKYDVGLVRLARQLELNDLVALVALNYDWVGGGERASVTGWGTTELWGAASSRLQLLHVTTLSPAACEEALQAALVPPFDPAVEVCTRHERGAGYGMCHGDSGSPVVDGGGRQIGIVSWGSPCALGLPDLHARISGFRDFLEHSLNDSD